MYHVLLNMSCFFLHLCICFQAGNKKELPFQAGQQLFLAPKDLQPQVRGWLLASDGAHVGLAPANYLKILGLRNGSPQPAVNIPDSVCKFFPLISLSLPPPPRKILIVELVYKNFSC